MCIICNLDVQTDKFPDRAANTERAEGFLLAFQESRRVMREATMAMAECAQIDRRYGRTHKRMVRLAKEWNRLEQSREAVLEAQAPTTDPAR